jgi:hypothetical protein
MHLLASSFNCATSLRRTLVLSMSMGKGFSSMLIVLAATPSSIPRAVGPIDILAVDDAGAFFVFELKRARSRDHAIGQLTRYMGWVRQTIGKDRAVNGIIVAKEISESLRHAVSVVPNVSLFEYEVEFHLKPAHQLR